MEIMKLEWKKSFVAQFSKTGISHIRTCIHLSYIPDNLSSAEIDFTLVEQLCGECILFSVVLRISEVNP